MRCSRLLVLIVVVFVLVACSGGDSGGVFDSSATSEPSVPIAEAPVTGDQIDPSSVLITSEWGPVVAGEIVVVTDDVATGAAEVLATAVGGEIVDSIAMFRTYRVVIAGDDEDSLSSALAEAQRTEGIAFASPNSIGLIRQTPAPCQVGEDDFYSGDAGWAAQAIGVDRAYQLIRASGVTLNDVRVRVIDRGLVPTPDLATVTGELDRDVLEGRQYGGSSATVQSDHSADVASLIGADWRDGGLMGVAGGLGSSLHLTVSNAVSEVDENGAEVAYKLESTDFEAIGLDPTQWLDVDGMSEFKVLQSIVGVLEADPRPTIVNLSAGSFVRNEDTSAIFSHWLKVIEQEFPDVLFITAASNDGRTHDGTGDWLAGKATPNNITVSSIDSSGAKYRNSGVVGAGGEITLAAPGVSVAAGIKDGRPVLRTGNSYATPQVTAAAALVRSINPKLTAAQVKQILVDSAATELGGVPVDSSIGGRLLRVDRAVEAALKTVDPAFDASAVLAAGWIDVVTTQTGVGSFEIDASIGSVTGGVTTIELETSGPGSAEGLLTMSLESPGDVTWRFDGAEQGIPTFAKITRTDNGACQRVTLLARPWFAGTYVGEMPIIAVGFGEIGSIPVTITIDPDLTFVAELSGSMATTIQLVDVVYSSEGACAGTVTETGEMTCSGTGSATVSAGGFPSGSAAGPISGSGNVADGVIDAVFVGTDGAPVYFTLFRQE